MRGRCMKKKIIASLLSTPLFLLTNTCFADNLMSVYNQAVKSYPLLKQYSYVSKATAATSASFRGTLLPAIGLTGTLTEIKLSPSAWGYTRSSRLTKVKHYGLSNFKATLTQTLFNLPTWLTYQSYDKLAASASATYSYQQQQFMGQVAKAYFDVLQAQVILGVDQAQMNYLQKMLAQAREKYKVGLSTKSEVQQANAAYFAAQATYSKDKNGYSPSSTSAPSLQAAIESLRQLTGKKYKVQNLADIKSNFPFHNPKPANIDYWVKHAKLKNLNLEAKRQASAAAHATVRSNYSAWVPSVSFVGNYNYNKYSTIASASSPFIGALPLGKRSTSNSTVAINLSWNIFSGGANFANAFKAASTYEAKLADQRLIYRQTLNAVRQDYLTLIKDVSAIDAYKQAVISGQASVEQYEAEYRVGTKNITDLLAQIQLLSSDQQKLSQAKYQYIFDYLQLKLDAGLISVDDLHYLNSYLA